jgi:glycosyltransferase involved in cell wall biosynthesis
VSRILVVGAGVPALVRADRHAGPGLRSAHFAAAIAAAGHDVLLLAVLGEDEAVPAAFPRARQEPGAQEPGAHEPAWTADSAPEGAAASHWPRIEFVRERDLASPAVRARVARFAPDAVVGATAYASALAARLRLEVPLWADVFGDLMAEAQAKAARTSSDWSLVHFWTLLRTVLERGDRFSAVSQAQSHALVGQLGLAGRLSSRTTGEELVSVIPCAAEARRRTPDRAQASRETGTGGSSQRRCGAGEQRRHARRALGVADDDFVLLVSGGVNTWCDVETLCTALALALEAEPRLRVVVTGGAIPGHDETSHAELDDRLAGLPAARVTQLGWIDSERLPDVYAAADLGLHVEKPIYERRLGAENRVVEWLAHGLVCVTTAESESGAAFVGEGLSLGAPAGDPAALAAVVVAAAGDAGREEAARILLEARRRGPDWTARERSYAATAGPLVRWCAAPCFARDRDGARLLQLGLVSQPETSAEMLEAYVAGLPMREIARRGVRWLLRRAHGAVLRVSGRAGASGRAPSRRAWFRASGWRW